MADREMRQALNVDGSFYVDDQCIDCDVCREIAPDVFRQNVSEGYSYVWQQPRGVADVAMAREAIEECPVEAIGSDG